MLTVLTDTELRDEPFTDFLVRHGWSRIAAVGMEWCINAQVFSEAEEDGPSAEQEAVQEDGLEDAR